jgi:hypothetical protein
MAASSLRVVPVGVLTDRDEMPDAQLEIANTRIHELEGQLKRMGQQHHDTAQHYRDELLQRDRELRDIRERDRSERILLRGEVTRLQDENRALLEKPTAAVEVKTAAIRKKLRREFEKLSRLARERGVEEGEQKGREAHRQEVAQLRDELYTARQNPRLPRDLLEQVRYLQTRLAGLLSVPRVNRAGLTGRDLELADAIGAGLEGEERPAETEEPERYSGLEID